MKAYYMGKYYSAESTKEELQELLSVRPHLYYQVLEPDVYLQHPDAGNYSIWQVYFDDKSYQKIDCNFKGYKNGETPNFENDVLLDVWKNKSDEWVGADYVGVLSWRMFEKTGLNGYDVIEKLNQCDTDAVVIFPRGYERYQHPFTREGYKTVNDLVSLVDDSFLLPVKLKEYDVIQNVWCNYWMAKPHIFDEYIHEWLLPCMGLIGNHAGVELHRGKLTPAQTFFYEGLFSVYLSHKQLSFKVI